MIIIFIIHSFRHIFEGFSQFQWVHGQLALTVVIWCIHWLLVNTRSHSQNVYNMYVYNIRGTLAIKWPSVFSFFQLLWQKPWIATGVTWEPPWNTTLDRWDTRSIHSFIDSFDNLNFWLLLPLLLFLNSHRNKKKVLVFRRWVTDLTWHPDVLNPVVKDKI